MVPVYTCLKELIVNAVKANFKHIYFEGYKPKNNANELISYETALKMFKLEMCREEADYLGKIARRNDIKAEITFKLDGNKLKIVIKNPIGMTDRERKNAIKKLSDARSYEDIGEYFLNCDEDEYAEGAGLGLVLITIILKSLGVNKNDFNLIAYPKKTIANIVIPLSNETIQNYQSCL